MNQQISQKFKTNLILICLDKIYNSFGSSPWSKKCQNSSDIEIIYNK